MKYKVGMYGGSFDPLHLGHIHNIIKAAALCDTLYIVISWCQGRESTSKELRYRWILNSTNHLPNVKIIMVEDTAATKEEYDANNCWETGARDIKVKIGEPINAVFCGDDYRGTNRFESLYGPEAEVVYFPRGEVPVSSTEIRQQPSKYWEYIPQVCKAYYTKKVLVVGGESTGKSTLVQNLALAYNTNFVGEVGRETCQYAGGEELMIAEDLHENLLKQRIYVDEAAKHSNRILFVDTDALTTKFYADFLLGAGSHAAEQCGDMALAIHNINQWDLVFFLEPTVAFIQDGTRNEEIAAHREKYSGQIKTLLTENGVDFICLSGDYGERFAAAQKIIEEKLGIATNW